jgi:hypothetical protein
MIEQASLIIGDGNWAVKSDSLLGYALPQGKYTPREMSVVRATTGTRVNAEGLVEVVPYNLVQYSEQINNAIWVKGDATISANSAIAPNGKNTADKFIANSNNAAHLFYQAVPTGSCSFSIYAKAAEETVFSMWLNDFSKNARFDLSTGTVVFSNVTSANITDVGNGWFRCEVYDTTLTSFVAIFGRNAAAYIGNGVDGMFFWGAQAVEGTEAKDYLPTTTRLNIARIDYSTGSPALLVEPQRTNIITYSEQFDNAAWIKADVTTAASSEISPSGIANSEVISETNITSSFVFGSNTVTYLASTKYSLSIYAKWDAATTRNIHLRLGNCPSVNIGASFDKNGNFVNYTGGSNGTLDSYSSTDVGNGWWRFEVNVTTAAISSAGFGAVVYYLDGTNLTYAGSTTQKINWWGAQLELGSYPTSYIPTTSASVTRNADQVLKTGISSLIGTEFTLFFDGFETTGGVSTRYIVLKGSGGIYANAVLLEANASNQIVLTILNSSSATVFGSFSPILTSGQRFKLAVRCKNNDFAFYVNGSQVATQASGSVPTTSDLYLGYYTDYADNYNEINATAIWKQGLTNAQLAQLTTI